MELRLHANATTTPKVRALIQASDKPGTPPAISPASVSHQLGWDAENKLGSVLVGAYGADHAQIRRYEGAWPL